MKKLTLFLPLVLLLWGCGGGGSTPGVTVTLSGFVSNGAAQTGQPQPAIGFTVAVTDVGKSADITSANPGNYSISGIPVGGTYTVTVTPDQPGQTATVTCKINIPDSKTLNITDSGGGACASGGGVSGQLVLNVTLPTGV